MNELASLREAWECLTRRSQASTVFSSWQWHQHWWDVYARQNDRLHVLAVFHGDNLLVALLPLYRRWHPWPPLSRYMYIGTGENTVDEVATEYADILIDPEHRDPSLALLREHFVNFRGWFHLEFRCVLENAPLAVLAASIPGASRRCQSAGFRYEIALERNLDDYLASLGSSRERRIRRSLRALERDGGLTVESLHEDTPNPAVAFDAAFRDLIELSHERQAATGRKYVFASERFRDFHARLARSLLANEQADIIRVRVGHRLIAVLYCFQDHETCHYYQSGFAARDANRYMPLTVAHLLQMQRCRERGIERYDFMRGDEDSYKQAFGCELTPMMTCHVYPNERLAMLGDWQMALRGPIRRLADRVSRALGRFVR